MHDGDVVPPLAAYSSRSSTSLSTNAGVPGRRSTVARTNCPQSGRTMSSMRPGGTRIRSLPTFTIFVRRSAGQRDLQFAGFDMDTPSTHMPAELDLFEHIPYRLFQLVRAESEKRRRDKVFGAF